MHVLAAASVQTFTPDRLDEARRGAVIAKRRLLFCSTTASISSRVSGLCGCARRMRSLILAQPASSSVSPIASG
jgi:hypothetical protein